MTSPEIEGLFEQLESALQDGAPALLAKDRPIYIYGAGNIGKEICRILRREKRPVAAFLDRNAKPGSEWEQIPILPPDSDKVSPAQRQTAQVVVGVFNRDADTREIAEVLKSLGYGQVVSFLEFHHKYHADLGNRFWLTSLDYYRGQKQEIAAADPLWSDAASQDLYRSLLRLRFTMRYDALPAICPDNQYFPSDIPPWPTPVRFVDCGAFDGDTLRDLAEPGHRIPVEAVAAFEPDLANFQKLAEFSHSGALADLGVVCLYPCGVSSETTQVRFSEGRGEGSSVSASGEVVIQCVALDSALVGFRPNLIKMDIEGSELDALNGARQILRENRPGLAICVYHHAGHLWEIPLLVERLVPGGRHYLRLHGHNGLELVYYWLP